MTKIVKVVRKDGKFCLNSTRSDREQWSVSLKDISPLIIKIICSANSPIVRVTHTPTQTQDTSTRARARRATDLRIDNRLLLHVEPVEHLHFPEEVLLTPGQVSPQRRKLKWGETAGLGRLFQRRKSFLKHLVLKKSLNRGEQARADAEG